MFDWVRRVIAVLIAVGLAAGVYLAWPQDGDDSDDGETLSSTTTTMTPVLTTTTTPAGTTTMTGIDSHVVTTVEEAEEILRELWFGWFEGIYNQDEERIREVVATEHQFTLALEQFGVMQFDEAPQPMSIDYQETEVLLGSESCTVVLTTAEFTGFTTGVSTDVHVLRWNEGWRIFSLWALQGDLWEADCDASLS